MCVTNMWNILFLGLLISTTSIFCDVSHLLHNGYPTHRPNNPLELPGQGSSATSVTDYPNVSAENRFQIPGASTGVSPNQIPDTQEKGSSSGAQISHDHSHDHGSGHHHHGEDGRYNPHDDGTGWDIRKSVPGEPGRDYPVYDEVPSTSFTCKQKVPGYYADEEAGCQAFRICTTDSYKTAYNFLCPNGTLFNQRVLTCDWWMNVDCTASSEFYYRNQEIGKMPTGQQLMKEVTKMLEAPNKKPYIFTQQQTDAIANMIKENSDERFSQDFYVPPKVVTSTTQVYIPPPVSSTTLVYIPPPVSSTTQVYIPPVTTTTTTTTTPLPPKISQTSLGTVQTPQVQTGQATGSVGYEQKKIDQTSNEAASGGYSYPQPKQTISSSTGFVSNQQNNQPIPSVTVTKEKTHTVTHSEKVTHVFKDVQDGPVKIPLLDNQNVVSTNVPTGIQQNAISQSQQPGFIQTGTSGFQQQEFIQTGIPQVQQPNLQPKLQAPTGFPKITKEEAFQQIDQIQTAIPQVQQPIFQSNLQTSTGFTQPKITKEEAFQQINQIQTGLNQIKEQQTQLNNLGHGILNPRVNAPGIPVQNFGATRFTNTEIPQGFTHQGVQPILFDSQNFPAQGYQQSSFHQNSFQSSVPNLQQSSFHQNNFQSSVPNLNTQFFQGGLANNFKGLSEQSTFRGQNNQFREVTKVDIVPSLGFHLNDEFERNTYISAVSKGLIRDGYQVSGSQSYGQNIFSPSDARFSSYQGPSSYLVPQSSVEGLPSNSGYRYR